MGVNRERLFRWIVIYLSKYAVANRFNCTVVRGDTYQFNMDDWEHRVVEPDVATSDHRRRAHAHSRCLRNPVVALGLAAWQGRKSAIVSDVVGKLVWLCVTQRRDARVLTGELARHRTTERVGRRPGLLNACNGDRRDLGRNASRLDRRFIKLGCLCCFPPDLVIRESIDRWQHNMDANDTPGDVDLVWIGLGFRTTWNVLGSTFLDELQLHAVVTLYSSKHKFMAIRVRDLLRRCRYLFSI